MARETKAQKAERTEAIEELRRILKPGDVLRTTVRHVARSGMSRTIDIYKIEDGEILWLSGLVAKALGWPRARARGIDGIKVDGCGMDMCFHTVYCLSRTLYPSGFGCIGIGDDTYQSRCPSNDHSNGDRDYTPHCYQGGVWQPGDAYMLPSGAVDDTRKHPNYVHWHSDGGYALRQRGF